MNLSGVQDHNWIRSYLALSSDLYFGCQVKSDDFCELESSKPSESRFFLIVGNEFIYKSDFIPIPITCISQIVSQAKSGMFRSKVEGSNSDDFNFVSAAYIGEDSNNNQIILGLLYTDEWRIDIESENHFAESVYQLRRYYNAFTQSSVIKRFFEKESDFRYIIETDSSYVLSKHNKSNGIAKIAEETVDDYIGQSVIPRMLTGNESNINKIELDKRLKIVNIIQCTLLDTNLTLLAINMNQPEDDKKKAFNSLISNFAHKARGKIGALQAAVSQISYEKGNIIDDDDITLTEVIRSATDSICSLVDRLEQYCSIPPSEKGKVDINRIIREIAKEQSSVSSNRELNLVLSSGPGEVKGDVLHLKKALGELVANAHECGKPGEKLEIVTSHDGDKVSFKITNAIESEYDSTSFSADLDYFEPFFALKSNRSGMGLAIAKKIILDHGGRIQKGEADNQEFQVEVELPAWSGKDDLDGK